MKSFLKISIFAVTLAGTSPEYMHGMEAQHKGLASLIDSRPLTLTTVDANTLPRDAKENAQESLAVRTNLLQKVSQSPSGTITNESVPFANEDNQKAILTEIQSINKAELTCAPKTFPIFGSCYYLPQEKAPKLYTLVKELCLELQYTEQPFILLSPKIEAFAQAYKIPGVSPFIIVEDDFLRLSTDKVLSSVLAHELSHCKYNHTTKSVIAMMAANYMALKLNSHNLYHHLPTSLQQTSRLQMLMHPMETSSLLKNAWSKNSYSSVAKNVTALYLKAGATKLFSKGFIIATNRFGQILEKNADLSAAYNIENTLGLIGLMKHFIPETHEDKLPTIQKMVFNVKYLLKDGHPTQHARITYLTERLKTLVDAQLENGISKNDPVIQEALEYLQNGTTSIDNLFPMQRMVRKFLDSKMDMETKLNCSMTYESSLYKERMQVLEKNPLAYQFICHDNATYEQEYLRLQQILLDYAEKATLKKSVGLTEKK